MYYAQSVMTVYTCAKRAHTLKILLSMSIPMVDYYGSTKITQQALKELVISTLNNLKLDTIWKRKYDYESCCKSF